MLREYIKAFLLGIVEGITEWLPVSSTGHLILLGDLLDLDVGVDPSLQAQFTSAFDVVIQLGAILAVVCLYARELIPTADNKKAAWSLWSRLALATAPAALIGLAADRICEHFLGCDLDTLLFTPQVAACALMIYGLLFILVESLTAKQKADSVITAKKAFAIGCFQALALIPGTSRSGATVLGARMLGVERKASAHFSFLAAVPVIGAASLLKLYDLVGYLSATGSSLPLRAYLLFAVAFVTAFAVSLLTVRFLTDFLKKHTLIPFGIYRILLGILVLFLQQIS